MNRTRRRGLGTMGIVVTCVLALATPSVAAEVLAPSPVTPQTVPTAVSPTDLQDPSSAWSSDRRHTAQVSFDVVVSPPAGEGPTELR